MMGFVELILREKVYKVKVYPFDQYGETNPDTPFFTFEFNDVGSMLFDVLIPDIRDAIFRAITDLKGRENIFSVRHIGS